MTISAENVFIHPHAIVEQGAEIGAMTRVWAFVHILPGAKIGRECNICDHVFIENQVTVGDRVTIKSGVQLWDGVHLEDDVFVGPNVTFTNDKFPRSKQYPAEYAQTIIRKGASIGANATILPNLVIGQKAMVGAGAVVTGNVPANAIVVGNPARIQGYVNQNSTPMVNNSSPAGLFNQQVRGTNLIHLPLLNDMRGKLSVGEFETQLPFIPKRYFLVFDVPSSKVRGEHAHKNLEQFLICVKGSCYVLVDDGQNRQEFYLNQPNLGLHIQPKVWATQYKHSPDAVLLVFASDIYNPDDYIRDYDEFLECVKK